MMTARQAMQQAIERAQLAEWEGARVFLDIARELREGTLPVAASTPPAADPMEGTLGFDTTTLDGKPAYGAAQTEVIRAVDPPIYEAAGETLGETKSVPTRIAHPQPDALGPESTCLTPECRFRVLWIRGRGWVHDVPSHTASCDKAAAEVSEQ